MSLIVGCAGEGQGVIYNRHIDATYRPSEFWTQTGGRDLRTEIYGNPFPVDQDVLVSAVTAAMQGAHFGQNGRASCRERVCTLRVDLGGSRNKKKKKKTI